MRKILSFIIFLTISFCLTAQEVTEAYFKENYQKKETYITMRDGVKLFTSIYTPKNKAEKHPILFTRTPYSCSPYGEDKYNNIWAGYKGAYVQENYIFVFQDVRGRYMSEGVFEDVRPFNKNKKGTEIDEASDTYDAIDWLVNNVNDNNGKVGVMGTSYPGFYSTQAALSNHPALKAVSPQAPVTDWFMGDDFHHNGAFFAMDGFSFYSSFGKPHPKPTQSYGSGYQTDIKDNYKFFLANGTPNNLSKIIGDSIQFWHQMVSHPNYDSWWQARNARKGLYNVKPAMLWVGGLFDAEDCFGAWASYKACEAQSPTTDAKIVMGPWYHGQWSREGSYLGNVQFGSNTAAWYQQNIEVPFFNYHLKNKGTVASIPEACIFFTGANQWRNFAQWPPINMQPTVLYIGANNSLYAPQLSGYFEGNYFFKIKTTNTQAPTFYQYSSDPAHPVPYTEAVHDDRTREYMTDDQRFAARRPDVLTLSTPILQKDLTLAGAINANIFTAISTTDADFVVKIIDVYPDTFSYPTSMLGNNKNYPMGGYQMLVRAEVMRGKYRKSFEKPEPFKPYKITEVGFTLPDVAHTFDKGHRLMVQIQSSWFPLVDMNPQVFTNIYTAPPQAYTKSTINIYYDANHQSSILLPVLKSD